MTQWVDDPEGGRERGPRGIARAWIEVLVRPRRFFEHGVAPADQAPGLVFAVVVVAIYQGTRFALGVDEVPVVAEQPTLSAVFWLAAAAVIVTPVALHLTAAFQTLLLAPFAPDRGGVSETVQVIGYATAPCALAGVPVVALQALLLGYGAVLLVTGLSIVHRLPVWKAIPLGAGPAAIVFLGGFRGRAVVDALVGSIV